MHLLEHEFEDEMEQDAIRDFQEEIREEETKNLRNRVFEYCSDYYKRNGEPPDLDCLIEGLGLSDDADDHLLNKLMYDWIRKGDYDV